MTEPTHPLSPKIDLHHGSFTDLAGDTWHWDSFAGHWSSESGDDADPQALLTEIASLRQKIRDVFGFVRGLKHVLTFSVPEDFPR